MFSYTATSNQTVFTGADSAGNTLSIPGSAAQVYMNGLLLLPTIDYTLTTTAVTLTEGALAGDIVAVETLEGVFSVNQVFRSNHFVYTTATPTTTITGADDNGATLSYINKQIQVFQNGILLIDSADYTATNGTSVVLGVSTDSGDTILISSVRGSLGGLDSADVISLADATRIKTYVYTTASPTTTITGTDDNGATLSYVADKIQVFRNGILLIDSADYTATNQTSIILGVTTDSGDTVVISTFRGSRTTLDSADVLAIAGGAGGGTDSATVITLSGELKGSMFRINPQSLSINTTIDSNENAHCAGPISFDSGVTLTINGNLVIS